MTTLLWISGILVAAYVARWRYRVGRRKFYARQCTDMLREVAKNTQRQGFEVAPDIFEREGRRYEFGDRRQRMRKMLFEYRREIGKSLGECARNCGLTTVELSRIERGKLKPTPEQVGAISGALGLLPDQVLEGIPTAEEMESETGESIDAVVAMISASADAKQKGFKRGNGGRGEMQCPICKGTLCYSVASINGHIWGKCKTDGCVSWMQ